MMASSAMGDPIETVYGLLNEKTAIIESASPLGLDKLRDGALDPNKATSKGLGELILYLANKGVRYFYVGLGGSATNDGGYGMMKTFGVRFNNCKGQELKDEVLALKDLTTLDFDLMNPVLRSCSFMLLSDVKNQLCGENGATYTYGPQKGVEETELIAFDQSIKILSEVMEKSLGKKIKNVESSGAAGGLGGAFIGLFDAKVESGIEKILEILDIEAHLPHIDLVITGEGRMDHQSIFGKAPIGVAKYAKKHNKPVIAIVGSVGDDIEKVYDHGIDLVIDTIPRPMTLEGALNDATENLELAAFHAIHAYHLRG